MFNGRITRKAQKLKAGGQCRGGHTSVKPQKFPHLSKKTWDCSSSVYGYVNTKQQWESKH